jgi:hypothetical protein
MGERTFENEFAVIMAVDCVCVAHGGIGTNDQSRSIVRPGDHSGDIDVYFVGGGQNVLPVETIGARWASKDNAIRANNGTHVTVVNGGANNPETNAEDK